MKRVGVAELKNNLSRLLRSVEIGETIEVMDRGRPMARIVPVPKRQPIEIRPAKRPFASIRDRTYPRLSPDSDSLKLLLEERAERPLPGGRR